MCDVQMRTAVEEAEALRRSDPEFAQWAAGYGAIAHGAETQLQVRALQRTLAGRGIHGDGVGFLRLLGALDRLANAGMWLVAHMTYACRVRLDGRPLQAEDFKTNPQGHMGGSLNMVPAYAGYLAINALTGITRAWLMGQGHCVSAVDALNVLVGNTTPAHAERYDVSDEGLSRMARDFYGCRLAADGSPESPLGSHVNVHTAGALIEGGFLGFAELLYPHIPLPGERLVAFLSDGAFEEQRGGDWAPRWWRALDCGMVTPILISNGRRIDQRTIASQEGGPLWLSQHLKLNGFDPIVFDGRDPAAYVCAIWTMEERLQHCIDQAQSGRMRYPAPLPYAIAVAPKGAGFHGEGTNDAHGLPLGANPRLSPSAAAHFNASARRLWVPADELGAASSCFRAHRQRLRERDHPIAHREVAPIDAEPAWRTAGAGAPEASAMQAIDGCFAALVRAFPQLRARFGNPDESRSNHMNETLALLKHRVTDVEMADQEAVCGGVITALNEEAVICAALGNKGGLNIAVTYEAFAVKMQSALRQEIVFAAHAKENGTPARWLSVPLVLTSHTWENGKNEQSHQDPSLVEAVLGEPSDVARVLFPADFNSAAAAMRAIYRTQGQIFCVVAAKSELPVVFPPREAAELVERGAIRVRAMEHRPQDAWLALTAIGAYQLHEALKAAQRLRSRDIPYRLIYLLEPARLRAPRSSGEAAHVLGDGGDELYGCAGAHLLLCHTRPEPMCGLLQPLLDGCSFRALGYRNRGGTLDARGMLFANRCSWMHAVRAAAELLHVDPAQWLSADELAVVDAAGHAWQASA